MEERTDAVPANTAPIHQDASRAGLQVPSFRQGVGVGLLRQCVGRRLLDTPGELARSFELGDLLADLALRPAHEARDFLDRIAQPEAVGEVEEVHLRPWLVGVEVGPILSVSFIALSPYDLCRIWELGRSDRRPLLDLFLLS